MFKAVPALPCASRHKNIHVQTHEHFLVPVLITGTYDLFLVPVLITGTYDIFLVPVFYYWHL